VKRPTHFLAGILAALFLCLPVWADSDAISRLYNFTPNSTISSSQMNAELNQLVTKMNAKIGIGTTSTITGAKTFSSNITLTATPSAGGHVVTKSYVDGRYPTGYHGSAAPIWVSNTTFTVAFVRERDGTDAKNIAVTGSTTVDISTNGLNGLDTGSVAANTFYYLYAISKADASLPGLILSTVNESASGTITLPATYTLKRQLPFWVLTDSASHIITFSVGAGWPRQPYIWYRTIQTLWTGSGFNSSIVESTPSFSGGTATITNSYIPPICKRAVANFVTSAGSYSVLSITPHSASDLTFFAFPGAGNQVQEIPAASSWDVTQAINNATVHIDFLAGIVTEVP